MVRGMKCSSCGNIVANVCANCWRCLKCKIDCGDHMNKTINGEIHNQISSKKIKNNKR